MGLRAIRIAAIIAALAQTGWAAGGTRYLVSFRDGTTPAQREAALRELGASKADDLSEIGALVAEVPGDQVSAKNFELKAAFFPDVLEVQEDIYRIWLLDAGVHAAPFPSPEAALAMFSKPAAPVAPVYPLPAGVDPAELPWGVRRVNAAGAWGVTMGEGVKVAVIDTGIDCAHPDLAANCAGGYNAIDSSKPPMDENSHGTHVAGTIAGALDGKGVAGIAPKASLYAVKVLDANGGGGLTSIIKGLIWAGKNKMDVANLSLGGPMGLIVWRAALKYASMKGVAVFVAAGNDSGAVNYPAAYPEAICVSALSPTENIADFSSRGNQVQFIAPGVKVRSTVPGGGWKEYSGTSMATPHMAGLGALAVAKGYRGEAAVRAALRAASTPIPALGRRDQGAGVVDAARLVGAP